jgi:hypothetical protein
LTAFRVPSSQTRLLLAGLALSPAWAQQPPAPVPGIQDDSFLIEEAYNQEPYVVQHISSFTRSWRNGDFAAAFTQEWPVPEHARHQLSYTLTGLGAGSGAGWGDTLLNYRYQVRGGAEARVSFSPRISLLLPTGQSELERGFGGPGFQGNLPVSIVHGSRLVTHWNAGATVICPGRNRRGERATLTGYNLGQSFVYLAHPRFNVLLETVWSGSEMVASPRQTQRTHSLLVSPGVRWAYNFASGLQIVPGVAFPVGVGPSAGERAVLLYLSFEHRFGKGGHGHSSR